MFQAVVTQIPAVMSQLPTLPASSPETSLAAILPQLPAVMANFPAILDAIPPAFGLRDGGESDADQTGEGQTENDFLDLHGETPFLRVLTCVEILVTSRPLYAASRIGTREGNLPAVSLKTESFQSPGWIPI